MGLLPVLVGQERFPPSKRLGASTNGLCTQTWMRSKAPSSTLSINHRASVWMQHLACHIRGVFGCQEDIARCHLFRFPCPLPGNIRAERFHLFGGNRRGNEWCPNRTRRDSVYTDTLLGQTL